MICILSRPKRRGLDGSPVKLFFTLETISRSFNVPISKAAENFGLGLTAFKHVCRKFGIWEWPYRRTKRLNALMGDPTDYKSALQQQSNSEKEEEAAEENNTVLDFALSGVFFETSPSDQCSSDDKIDFTDVSFQDNNINDSKPCGFEDSSAQFLFTYSFGEDFRKTDPVDTIPDAAALQPFVDPFHGDWETTTSVAACTQGTCLSSI